ncbi:hypothetical protein WJX81_006700 [Elliptochloris bilobata]|uniref:Elongation factor 1-gamma n=1 Tax=Elliptochloris bilobata TaxID=381761 RepID=A0AAW1RMK1_9CHLO
MTLKLYTYPGNKNAFKALIAAQYVGTKIEVPSFSMGVDNKKPEFLKLNPNGKVPTLETPTGGVWESNAIARYVARLSDKGLFGASAFEEALVEQWIDFTTTELDAPLLSWILPILGHWPYDKKKEEGAIAAVKKAMALLDRHLTKNTYLVGHAATLADIVGVCNLYHGYTKLFDEGFRKSFPHVTRWWLTLAHQPAFAAVLGEVKLCQQPMKFTPPKKDAAEKADGAAKKEAAPKKEKEPKKESAPKKAAAVEEEDPAEPKPEPKAKNPLDELPKSTMVLDAWKRLYSNTPGAKFREIAVNGLWAGADIPNSPTQEHFAGYDPEGFSIWFCDYKYPEENTVNYIVMNKVGGFLQRIDYVRKYAFGVMCILKDDKGQFPIRGVWIFRGQGIPPIMLDECYDLELYNWTRVDIADPKQKARVEDMIAEEATIDGLEHIECKIFK